MGFLSSYDGELREPLVWPQGSPVSIRVARGSAALLSKSQQGNQASRHAEGGISRSFLSCGRKPWFSSTFDGDLGALLMAPMGSQEYGGVGTPLGSVQWKRASSRVEAGTSGFLSCSDVGLGVCMPFQTGSQVSTCLEA